MIGVSLDARSPSVRLAAPAARRRGALRALAALSIAALAAACGRQEPRRPDALVFRHPKLFGDPEPLDRLVGQFERAHGVAVRREALPAASDEQHLFYAINLAAETTEFDVLALDTIWAAEFAQAGWLRDLSAHVSAADERDLFAAPLASVTWRARRYALPWFVDAGLLYYRADLLAAEGLAPPRTWTDLAQAVRRVRVSQPALHGFVWQGKQYEGLVCNALEFIWSHGGDLDAGAPAAVRGLAFMRALVTDGLSPPYVTTLTEEPARVLFGRARALFLRNWPYAWSLLQRAGSEVEGRVGVCPLPHAPGHPAAAALGGWHLGVNAFSRHAAVAEKLAAFLCAAPAQKALALAYGYSAPRRSLYADPELAAAQPFLASLATLLEAARPRPVSPHYVALSQVLQSEFSAVLSGRRAPAGALGAIARARRVLEAV
ncbi:MAG: ABC transporter substrate-binding protein [Betaproteobacteria bacterium]|nr:MAG: ABC transporter substrate-binding protein [Betaproteobacteria bacterium]